MMNRLSILWVVVCFGVVAGVGGPAFAADNPRVVLLTLPGKGDALQAPLHNAVAGELKGQAEVIGFKEFSAKAAQLNVSGRAMFSPRGLTAVAKELRADHAVLVRAVLRTRGTDQFFKLILVVLNVATGKRKGAGSITLEGQRLTAEGVDAIVDAIRPFIGQPVEEKEEFADLEELAPEEPEPEPEPVKRVERARPAKRVERVEPARPTETLKVDASAQWEGPTRAALRLHMGAGLFQRLGIIRSEGQSSDFITCFCGEDGSANSMIGGANIMGEFYPLELTRWNTWARRLGVHVDATTGTTTTRVNNEQFESRVISGMGGLVVRVPLDPEEDQGDFQVRAGYGYFAFPLQNFPFPGVSYSGPYLGGVMNYPVSKTTVAKAGAYINAPLFAGEGTERLGTSYVSGNGYRLEAGARMLMEKSRHARYEMIFLGRVDGYKTAYRGVTELNLDIQAVNAKLVDRVFTFLWTLGVAL